MISMITFGSIDLPNNGEEKPKPKNIVKFKRVYSDLISKKVDNNTFPHFVATINSKHSDGCFAQAYVRQGKQMGNYIISIQNEFDEAKAELKRLEKYKTVDINPLLFQDELTLEINSDYLESIQLENVQDEQSQSNENEEAGDYRNNPHEEIGKIESYLVDDSVENSPELPASRATKRVAEVSLIINEESKSKQNSNSEETGILTISSLIH
jgi:hypothetical protein